jgi:hypothetical protein
MEVSGQLLALAAYLRKENQYPLNRKLSGRAGRSNVLKNRKYVFSLYGFEPRIFQSVDYALYRLH